MLGATAAIASTPAIEVGRTVAGLEPAALVARYGSPLFVYDAAVLRARAAALQAALQCDRRLKGSPLKPDIIIEKLILDLCRTDEP